jgi:hypothetical protein
MAPVVKAIVKRKLAVGQLRQAYQSIFAMILYCCFVLFVLATLSQTNEQFQVSAPKTLAVLPKSSQITQIITQSITQSISSLKSLLKS